MTKLTIQWIVPQLAEIKINKLTLKNELNQAEEALKKSPEYIKVQELSKTLQGLNKEEIELNVKWKELMIATWAKKIESIAGAVVQLNKKPWKLIIESEDDIPGEYIKTKTTTSVDKTALKKALKEWEIYDWVYIEEDFTFVCKFTD